MIGILLLLLSWGAFASPLTDSVLSSFSAEPSAHQVQSWASLEANTQPETVEKWLRSSQRFAALPTLWLRYRVTNDWDQDFAIAEGSDPQSAHRVVEDAGAAQESQLMIQARWDLQKLVWSTERIRLLDHTQDVVKLRDRTLSEANRLYFERRRVQVEMLLAPKMDTLGQVEDELRLRELTAGLDALTGGRFSEALSMVQRR